MPVLLDPGNPAGGKRHHQRDRQDAADHADIPAVFVHFPCIVDLGSACRIPRDLPGHGGLSAFLGSRGTADSSVCVEGQMDACKLL